ncbi:MAG TPA: hypothetical protein VF020_18865 [Chthoniobacterales bacterium]
MNPQQKIKELHGELSVTKALSDHERELILRALGFSGELNPRAWSTESLVTEIKDSIAGERMLSGEGAEETRAKITSVIQLSPSDSELLRAWQTFPDSLAANYEFTWEYLGTVLIGQQWIHIFSHDLHPETNRTAYTRVPARPGWKP